MPSSTSKSKPKASEVAADTRRNYIPLIKNSYAHIYKTSSILFPQPLVELSLEGFGRPFGRVPVFYVRDGDPASVAMDWASHMSSDAGEPVVVPFICSANDKRPGGDWETGVNGSEERLCRRSTLSATLATPEPGSAGSYSQTNYPIPIEGGILSDEVVIFRAPHDRYEKLPPTEWGVLPVCSVPPVRWPKLTQMGTKYSFAEERDMVKRKLRAALYICVARGYTSVVVGDFGLGNGYRNPPQEIAELWREVILWDADLRGRLEAVAFVFDDTRQSTHQLILDDLSKKSRHGKASSSKGSSSSSSNSSSSSPADFDIFQYVFSSDEIERAVSQPDPRYDLETLMSPM
ncbi:hypothetical protein SPBR_06062 [Sporothrix brasiliensis 5110]|uniref:Microbial-type PARG catalytic domain-containing protein n=1 Tax=Sporothrix brasiliensis 5110 TaxID=1398154 RepID=A0A0C2FSD1_9PEZI|nr:uncharacterized protein SPBR_06062 [Sporothrix brasiliensis 5110]KIH93933.1 hypothetical protein SPBR_06062 [Sporothrix brasiliensis 5110]